MSSLLDTSTIISMAASFAEIILFLGFIYYYKKFIRLRSAAIKNGSDDFTAADASKKTGIIPLALCIALIVFTAFYNAQSVLHSFLMIAVNAIFFVSVYFYLKEIEISSENAAKGDSDNTAAKSCKRKSIIVFIVYLIAVIAVSFLTLK